MAQVGLNTGAWHARSFGWAKAFVKKRSQEEMVAEDMEMIGAMSVMWAFVKAYAPQEITAHVQNILNKSYPPLATRNIPIGIYLSLYSHIPKLIMRYFRYWLYSQPRWTAVYILHS